MERTSSIRRKALARQHKAEVMIAGEQLRLRLHDGKLIKDRRYHLRTYPNCFVAEELVTWLVNHKEAPDRTTAVHLMQHLMDQDIVHHVCDRSGFKDAKLLYRFRKDDGTFPFNKEVKIFMRGQRLYEHLIGDKHSILQLREEHGVAYQRSFLGCQLIDWLLQNGEAVSRCQGLELCRALEEQGIIQHVAQKHDFFDSGLLYQFRINFRRRRRLSELLSENEQDNCQGKVASLQEDQPDSPFVLHKNPPLEPAAGFQSVGARQELKIVTSGQRGSSSSLHSAGFPPIAQLSLTSVARCNPDSVLKRHFTCEELLAPAAQFTKRVLTVTGDALGWGFVIRGAAPCYVQAVDPGGPAAAAGVKVRQLLCQVNGQCVLYLDYRKVSTLIMTGPRIVVLEVMETLE